MMKLYYTPGACSMASHIALEEAGAEHELQKVDLAKGEQRTPEYLAINPKGVTPALQTDRGVLTENPVIIGYIAQEYPDAKLAPTDSFAFGSMQSFNMFLSSSLHPALGKVLFSRPPLEGQAKDDARDAAVAKLRLVEDSMFKGPWVTGAEYTVADGYLYVFERWSKAAGLLDDGAFPKLSEHMQRVQERPKVRKALEHEGLQPL